MSVLERKVWTEGFDTFLDGGSVSYAPSIVQTDFSEHLPLTSVDTELELSKHYNVSAVVGSAWTSLQSEVPKLPWETRFLEQFFGSNENSTRLSSRWLQETSALSL